MAKKTDISMFKKDLKKEDMYLSGPKAESAQKRGPKPKAPEEKADVRIALNLTRAEEEKLKKKAGMVPLATFLMHHLRDETDIFK